MRAILLRYTLRDGTRGTLHYIATSTCAAVVAANDIFGEALRSCSAKTA